MNRVRHFLWPILALLSVASAAALTRVVDGDTIEIDQTIIRIHGIDAPEAGQDCADNEGTRWPCGRRAISRLEALVHGHTLTCAPKGIDAYGRTLAVCLADGTDVGATLVGEGLAWSFRKYSHDYDAAEDDARRRAVGVFQADTETPWDFRAHRWEAAAQQAPDPNCLIKGNVSAKGARIFHAPWSPWYGKTRIKKATGERWFCSEGDAMAAGWRAPYWGR